MWDAGRRVSQLQNKGMQMRELYRHFDDRLPIGEEIAGQIEQKCVWPHRSGADV
jgi:hypothetical protein